MQQEICIIASESFIVSPKWQFPNLEHVRIIYQYLLYGLY